MEKVILDFISYLVNKSGLVYFVTSNGVFGKKTVEMDIQYFNEENIMNIIG